MNTVTPGLDRRVGSRSKLKQHELIKAVPFCIKMNVSFIKNISFFLVGDLLSLKNHTKERKM